MHMSWSAVRLPTTNVQPLQSDVHPQRGRRERKAWVTSFSALCGPSSDATAKESVMSIIVAQGRPMCYLPLRGIAQSSLRMWTNWSFRAPLPGPLAVCWPSVGDGGWMRRTPQACVASAELVSNLRAAVSGDALAPDGSAVSTIRASGPALPRRSLERCGGHSTLYRARHASIGRLI